MDRTEVHQTLVTYEYYRVHLNCLKTDRNKIPHDPPHLGVPSGVSKLIYGLWYV
jgi:hypothetical protein